MKEYKFAGGKPEVLLINAFTKPFENAVATAKTCYSAKNILPDDIIPSGLADDEKQKKLENAQNLAHSIFDAGHHTTLQHAHFQFLLTGVSRHFVWSLLHSHPFYNSEQQSQRYVAVKPENFVIPELSGAAKEIYEQTIALQNETYTKLNDLLYKTAEDEYLKRFPKIPEKKLQNSVIKKVQEISRYALSIAAKTKLYHTISLLTLLRYCRLNNASDTPTESAYVIEEMKQQVLKFAPELEIFFEPALQADFATDPLITYNFPKPQAVLAAADFDADLAGKTSKLLSAPANPAKIIGIALRQVLGLTKEQLSDKDAVDAVFNLKYNHSNFETLNLSTQSKILRVLHHLSYTFMKKLSHSADSQDQRHRLTPASRPYASAFVTERVDYITPRLIEAVKPAKDFYDETMNKTWEAVNKLLTLGVKPEFAHYLLPNALALRFVESFDIAAFRHKAAMRLCFGAQEEIFNATLDEVEQIQELHPEISSFLLAPCQARAVTKEAIEPDDEIEFSRFCREGERYCGVPVWRLKISELREARGLL